MIITGCGDPNDPVEIESFEDQELMTYQKQIEEIGKDSIDVWKVIAKQEVHYSEISFRDIDFDGEDEWVLLFKERGNRHYKEYKAFNIENNEPSDLVIHYREDAVFDPETKTVINHWSSNFCTHETETYQAMNNTLEMVRLEFSDYEPDGYGCILRIFESSSDSGNKSLQDFDDEMLRIIGEKRYGMSGANLELIDTRCWDTDRNFSEC
tara:strand:+ start:423 stop:1049 length:627 start_codon:yes stop_codon:yes gene_type:complete